jgi:hypothetical protein
MAATGRFDSHGELSHISTALFILISLTYSQIEIPCLGRSGSK